LSRGLLEKLIVSQLVNKFPAVYGTRRFITVSTRARHWTLVLSKVNLVHSLSTCFCRSILTLFSHLLLGLPSGLFPSGFPTKSLYTFNNKRTSPYEIFEEYFSLREKMASVNVYFHVHHSNFTELLLQWRTVNYHTVTICYRSGVLTTFFTFAPWKTSHVS